MLAAGEQVGPAGETSGDYDFGVGTQAGRMKNGILDGIRRDAAALARETGIMSRARFDSTIETIDHVQVAIPRGSEDEARRYYCDCLGLLEIEKPEVLR